MHHHGYQGYQVCSDKLTLFLLLRLLDWFKLVVIRFVYFLLMSFLLVDLLFIFELFFTFLVLLSVFSFWTLKLLLVLDKFVLIGVVDLLVLVSLPLVYVAGAFLVGIKSIVALIFFCKPITV